VPHLIGRQVWAGQALLGLYGLKWNSLPAFVNTRKWVICSQRPRAGAVVAIGTRVQLTVARPGGC
jgi:beta-lactam-binding protein with PASTA domain